MSTGTSLIIPPLMLAAIMLFERKTPGFKRATSFYGILGIAMAAVGLAIVSLGL
ncbi:MAG: hypothetical protein M1318_03010 [Firmicutes bacterium]|nr:hypothetical protein [Bacillota bacterium]